MMAGLQSPEVEAALGASAQQATNGRVDRRRRSSRAPPVARSGRRATALTPRPSGPRSTRRRSERRSRDKAERAVSSFGARRCRDAEGDTDRRCGPRSRYSRSPARRRRLLVYTRYAHTQIACTTGGCETVQHSRYAKLAGVPVAVLGLAAYLTIFATTLSSRVEAAAIAAAIAIAGLAFAIYLIVIQVAVIDAICQWCLASDAILAVLAVLSLERCGVLRESARVLGGGPMATRAEPSESGMDPALLPVRGGRQRRGVPRGWRAFWEGAGVVGPAARSSGWEVDLRDPQLARYLLASAASRVVRTPPPGRL